MGNYISMLTTSTKKYGWKRDHHDCRDFVHNFDIKFDTNVDLIFNCYFNTNYDLLNDIRFYVHILYLYIIVCILYCAVLSLHVHNTSV